MLTLIEASESFDLSTTYLALLIRQGKVTGQRIGKRLWLISETSLKEYTSQPHKPGPKPKRRQRAE